MELENETPADAQSASAPDNAAIDARSDNAAASNASASDNAASNASASDNAASNASADEQAASSASADEQAASSASADEQAASSASADEQAASNASADEQAGSNASADEQAASSASADKQAGSNASADEQAASNAGNDNDAASNASAEDLPPVESASSPQPLHSAEDVPPEPTTVSSEDFLPFEPEPSSAAGEDARLKAVIEAIIYVTDEPLALDQISAALEQPRDRVTRLLQQLSAEYEQPDRGLCIREVAGGYKISTKPEHHDGVRRFVKNLKPPLKLSLPALETLAVIAYKQPITAPEIMEIRGVQGAGVLKTLLDRKVIATAGRKNVVGKPILYKTTREFLVQFGLKDLTELPTLKEFQEIGRLDTETPTGSREEAPPASAAAAQSSEESSGSAAPPNESPDSPPPQQEPPPSETPVEDPPAEPDQPSSEQVE